MNEFERHPMYVSFQQDSLRKYWIPIPSLSNQPLLLSIHLRIADGAVPIPVFLYWSSIQPDEPCPLFQNPSYPNNVRCEVLPPYGSISWQKFSLALINRSDTYYYSLSTALTDNVSSVLHPAISCIRFPYSANQVSKSAYLHPRCLLPYGKLPRYEY